jgi:hypothetical protein
MRPATSSSLITFADSHWVPTDKSLTDMVADGLSPLVPELSATRP